MSIFSVDARGIDMTPKYELLPEGWLPFKIVEAEPRISKKGDRQVLAKCKCIDPRYPNAGEVWHYVTFLPKENKGAGIPLHFLKTIGQPYEGQFDVNAKAWLGKKFLGNVIIAEYNGKKNNKFDEISPYREDSAQLIENAEKAKEDEEIPF